MIKLHYPEQDERRDNAMETWKPIADYEGFYEVSDRGNVRSVDRYRTANLKHVTRTFIKGKLLKQNLKGNGYLTVDLAKDNKIRTTLVHRLVANAFIPNPNGLRFVNHKDSNRQNNDISNLEWVTSSENRLHGMEVGHVRYNSRKVRCVEKNKVFDRVSLAAEWVETNYPGRINGALRNATNNIRSCCKGRTPKAYGFTWKFHEGSTTIPKGSTPKRVEMGRTLPDNAGG